MHNIKESIISIPVALFQIPGNNHFGVFSDASGKHQHLVGCRVLHFVGNNKSPFTMVVIGKNDEIVNPIETKNILKESNDNIKIIEY
mgnify:CR=1 FL=1